MLNLAFCFVVATALFLYLNSQSLPWYPLFKHTFFGRQNFPLLTPQPVSISDYFRAIGRTLPCVVSWRTTLFFTLGGLLTLVPLVRTRIIGPPQLLAAIAVVNMVAYYLIFPIDEYGHERMFLSSYILIIASVFVMLQNKFARDLVQNSD